MIDKQNYKILVIDDIGTMRRTMRNMLFRQGFKIVMEADNGEHAWEKLIENKVDFIVCDWTMPKMSGFELLKRVKADSSLKKIPFLMVTAQTSEEEVAYAAETHVDGYMVKPFKEKTFEEKINSIIKKSDSPSKREKFLNLGKVLLENDQFDSALEQFKEALKLKQESAITITLMGTAYEKKEDYSLAEKYYKKAIKLNFQYLEAYEHLGSLYTKLKNFDKASIVFEKASEISPNNPDRLLSLGNVYLKLKDTTKAKNAFMKAIEFDNGNIDKRVEIGDILLEAGLVKEAESIFRISSKSNPEYTYLFNRLGIALRAQGKFEEAIKEYRNAIRIDNNDEIIYHNLGKAYLENDQKTLALEAFQKALKIDPDFNEAQSAIDSIKIDLKN